MGGAAHENCRRGLAAASKRPRKPRAPKDSYDTAKVLHKVWAASRSPYSVSAKASGFNPPEPPNFAGTLI